ncbi:MAG: phosphoribosylformylglycinamidine synthase subunit PurS [Candidatus Kapabacteria bacterium]|nr:phosphoribosylformylglycinamidine synthase subunit PurS [Ignavibacteriota bacterium]MCW5885683.1 phosphoribosylformylglycinamidine synthase subunit PurS [Candidatus Kapabacteria bacterium]
MFKAKINITLRESILDVQGKTIEHALHSLEYQNLNHVRIGKYVEINVTAVSPEAAYESVSSACSKLIANPIIEDYYINIEEISE